MQDYDEVKGFDELGMDEDDVIPKDDGLDEFGNPKETGEKKEGAEDEEEEEEEEEAV
jgi:hypothetical protein